MNVCNNLTERGQGKGANLNDFENETARLNAK